jgi:histidyl-tRNA synthetase
MAENKDVSKPAKWFYNIPVWRYEDTGEDRLREFWQSGIEYLGTEQLAHDAEAVALANQQLEDIGLEDAYFELNNRKFISGVLEEYGISQSKEQGALTVLDKLDKKERSDLLDEAENDKGIDRGKFEDVLLFLKSDYGFSDLDILRQQFDGNDTAREGIDELETLRSYLESYDAADSVEFSPTLARGLDYYTGIVFEGLHEDADSSIAGGGRYDDLISDIGGEATPGVGFALGNDRIINVLEENGEWDEDMPGARVYMIPVTDNQEDLEYAIEAATDIRQNGMETDIDFSGRSIGQAFSYVDNQDIPYAAVVGPDEREAGTVTIRDMDSGEEYEIPSSQAGQKLGEVRDRVE